MPVSSVLRKSFQSLTLPRIRVNDGKLAIEVALRYQKGGGASKNGEPSENVKNILRNFNILKKTNTLT